MATAPARSEWRRLGAACLFAFACADPSPGTPDAGSDVADAGALRVLFIGNSYTYVNDLPGMLATIARSTGEAPAIAVEQVVAGGERLIGHWNGPTAQARIAERTWTHVVLQEQSQTPPSEAFSEAARLFGEAIVAAGARPTWYVTWARQDAFEQEPVVAQDALTWAYAGAARQWPQSVLVCVGEAFRRSLRQHPTLRLHDTDQSHPTVAGTYLAASTFYVALTGRAVPEASTIPDGLSATDAALLRETARIGSDCADVEARALVRHEAGLVYGRASAPLEKRIYLANDGYSPAGLADAHALSPPFSWTNGAFPGLAGTPSDPACAATLPAQGGCWLSITYSGATTGSGQLKLDLSGAYTTEVAVALQGIATREAVLDARTLQPGILRATIGETRPFQVLVTNRGAAAASAVTARELTSPFAWGPTAAGAVFPGGSGTLVVGDATYDYCGPVLEVGRACVATALFTPTWLGSATGRIEVTYSTAEGAYNATTHQACNAQDP